MFYEKATTFANVLRLEKKKAWEEFASTLNYLTDPAKVMKMLKSINRDPPTNPIRIALTSSTNTKTINDKEKAELFRKTHAKPSKKPKTPKVIRKTMQKIKQNIKTCINTKNGDIESTLFASHELNAAIKYLKIENHVEKMEHTMNS